MKTEVQIYLEQILHVWNPALRSYKCCRELSSVSNKHQVAALAYSLFVRKIPPKKTAKWQSNINIKPYSEMLKFGDVILPNPFQLYEHMKKNWPPLFNHCFNWGIIIFFLAKYDIIKQQAKQTNDSYTSFCKQKIYENWIIMYKIVMWKIKCKLIYSLKFHL